MVHEYTVDLKFAGIAYDFCLIFSVISLDRISKKKNLFSVLEYNDNLIDIKDTVILAKQLFR